MKEEELQENLESVLAQLEIELRYEKGDFRGGLCRVKDKKICLINKGLPLSQKNLLIARSLSELDLSNIFMVPAVRKFIESTVAQSKLEA